MKTNALVRIIAYSLLILILTGILLAGIGIDVYSFHTNSPGSTNSESVNMIADDIHGLDIDWAAGSVTIVSAATDIITISESGNFDEKYAMEYAVQDHTLSIEYADMDIWFGSHPEKDLIITVPKGWSCYSLEIDGAALEIKVDYLIADAISLDGASIDLDYLGTFNTLECDGAACELNVTCVEKPYEIQIDGASCELELNLPRDCGFQVQTDGLGCSFKSNVPHTGDSGIYSYGDRKCQIDVDGMDCHVNINVD